MKAITGQFRANFGGRAMLQQGNLRRQDNKPTCLIVEDSEFDQKMMQRVIRRAQSALQIDVATTLSSARRALEIQNISLILLDNNLPDGLGANFALELAADPQSARIPVIIVSDWPTPFMWEKAQSAGVLYVVNKSEFAIPYVQAALNRSQRTSPIS